jgi:hypothetical protein
MEFAAPMSAEQSKIWLRTAELFAEAGLWIQNSIRDRLRESRDLSANPQRPTGVLIAGF